jgi:ABC-2 type transport system ATP-binding protein
VSQTVDDVVVIHHGRIRANSTLADLTRRREGDAVRVRSPQAGNLAELLSSAGGSVQRSDGDLLLVTGVSRETVGEVAAEHRVTLHELAVDQADASLEDVFLQLTRDEVADEAGDGGGEDA